MSDLVLEHLKRLQADNAELKQGVRDIKAEVIQVREILGGMLSADARRSGDIASLETRVERIKRRLELTDTPAH